MKDIVAPLFLVIIAAVIYILSLRNDREQANKKLEKVTDELSFSTNKLKQIQVNYTELQEELERHDQATRTLIRSQYAQREATMAAGSAWRNMELRELAETYPYIPFLPEEQTLSRILHDYIMDNPSIDANKLYHFHALNQYKFAFLRKNKDISICWLSDNKFWHQYDYLSELDQEYPELDPPDWKIRRRIVHEREQSLCQRCGKQLTLSQSHIHHIIPRCDLGTHHVENLSLLCPDCHTYMPDHEWMRDREKVGYYDERTSKWKSQFQEQLDLITNNGEYVYRW